MQKTAQLEWDVFLKGSRLGIYFQAWAGIVNAIPQWHHCGEQANFGDFGQGFAARRGISQKDLQGEISWAQSLSPHRAFGTFTDRITEHSGLEGTHKDHRRQPFTWMVPSYCWHRCAQVSCGHWRAHRGSARAMGPSLTPLCAPPAAHPAVPAPERPTATVSPLRTPSSPSRLPAVAIRPHPAVSPQHGHQPPAPGARPLIPLTSAAAAITPPNVSAAHLNGDVGGGPAAPGPAGKPEERKNEKVRAAVPLPRPCCRRGGLPQKAPCQNWFPPPDSLGILISHYFHTSSFPRHHTQHCSRITCSRMGNKAGWAEFVWFCQW